MLIMILVMSIALVGCNGKGGKEVVAIGDVVKVEYTGKLKDGSIFDSNVDGEPLEFTVGAGQMISGFDEAVVGMEKGESKTIEIAPDQAYGERDEKMIITVEKKQLPENINPEIGQKLMMGLANGSQIVVTIVEVSDTTVTLDANHELAGKDLIFDIKILDITKQE
jgi:peptidylprolyl isomerase